VRKRKDTGGRTNLNHASAAWLSLTCAVLAGCFGDIGSVDGLGQEGDVDGEPGQSSNTTKVAPLCTPSAGGSESMRRLSSGELGRTVSSLLGVDASRLAAFPESQAGHSFRTDREVNLMSARDVEILHELVETLAEDLARNPETLLGCAPVGAEETSCVFRFLARFAKRAYRRPADAQESAALEGVYASLRSQGFSVQEAVASVIEVVLQSPQFLYRTEAPIDNLSDGLTGYEIASRLSYAFWGDMPDQRLFDLADSGALLNPEVIQSEADRLMADPRFTEVLAEFVSDWLDLGRIRRSAKDTQRFPQWDDSLEAAVLQEVRWFLDGLLSRGQFTLNALLLDRQTYVNAALAGLYGVSHPGGPSNTGWVPIVLPEAERAGILTQAAFLASHADGREPSPVSRGAFVRARMLCQSIVPPPNLAVDQAMTDPNASVRERLAQHRDDAACSGCHALMDPIGYGFEHFDAIGRYRTQESNGSPVDVTGAVNGVPSGGGGPFEGAIELSEMLAQSEDVEACVATQWFRFAYGRDETPEDECAVANMQYEFSRSGGDFFALWSKMVGLPSFSGRRQSSAQP
jgi:hypothetical protein